MTFWGKIIGNLTSNPCLEKEHFFWDTLYTLTKPVSYYTVLRSARDQIMILFFTEQQADLQTQSMSYRKQYP